VTDAANPLRIRRNAFVRFPRTFGWGFIGEAIVVFMRSLRD
jgi:hypothetical protein